MPLFDIYASSAAAPITAPESLYSQLLLLHASDCMNGGASGESAAQQRLQGFLAKGKGARELGHLDLLTQLKLHEVSGAAIDKLPPGAVLLSFGFRLAKRYLSRDDAVFFPIDNPIRRDHVFKVPMVAAATWKGSLRAASVERLLWEPERDPVEHRLALLDLFGDEKSADEDDPEDAAQQDKLSHFLDVHSSSGRLEFRRRRAERARALGVRPEELRQRGRLVFFPSWFRNTQLDVLNPRDRKTRTGTLPIKLECVAAGRESTFTLLYLPFDLLGKPAEIAAAQRRDWKLLGEALAKMLLKTGFGAKKSSGCGRIQPDIEGVRFECKSVPFKAPAFAQVAQLGELGSAFAEVAG